MLCCAACNEYDAMNGGGKSTRAHSIQCMHEIFSVLISFASISFGFGLGVSCAPHDLGRHTVMYRNILHCVHFCELLGITKHNKNRSYSRSIAQSSHCIAHEFLLPFFEPWIIHYMKCEPCCEWFRLISGRQMDRIHDCSGELLPAIFLSHHVRARNSFSVARSQHD